jgi:hypothetical protein
MYVQNVSQMINIEKTEENEHKKDKNNLTKPKRYAKMAAAGG